MHDEHSFEQVRKDVEARQRNTVFPDTLPNGRTIDAFFWKGDPRASLIPRIGLVLFALCFILIAVVFASIPFQKEDGWGVDFFIALFPFLLAIRFLRNAFLRPPKHPGGNQKAR
jgi:hypothetical protein